MAKGDGRRRKLISKCQCGNLICGMAKLCMDCKAIKVWDRLKGSEVIEEHGHYTQYFNNNAPTINWTHDPRKV